MLWNAYKKLTQRHCLNLVNFLHFWEDIDISLFTSAYKAVPGPFWNNRLIGQIGDLRARFSFWVVYGIIEDIYGRKPDIKSI